MRGVDHQDVDPGLDQRLGALKPGRTGADRRADPQPPVRILAGVREKLRLLDVLDGHQADQSEVVVDHQQLLDAMLVQELLGLLAPDPLGHRHQAIRGHQFAHRHAQVGRKADVPVGQNADQAAGRALDHGDPGDPLRRHQIQRVGQRRFRPERDRVDHDAGLELLDLLDLARLRRDVEIAMDHAQPAVLSHGDRETGLGHGVHRRRDQRHAELDLAGEPGAHVDFGGQNFRSGGLEQDVVEGQGFADHDFGHASLARSLESCALYSAGAGPGQGPARAASSRVPLPGSTLRDPTAAFAPLRRARRRSREACSWARCRSGRPSRDPPRCRPPESTRSRPSRRSPAGRSGRTGKDS